MAGLDEQTQQLRELRSTRRAVILELEDLRRMREHPTEERPHAHLRRRTVPDQGVLAVRPGLLLRFWTEASLSILLAMVGVALLLDLASAPLAVVAVILAVMLVEAVLRGRAAAFLLAVAILVALVAAVWLAMANWRVGLGMLALFASISLAVANLRATLARR